MVGQCIRPAKTLCAAIRRRAAPPECDQRPKRVGSHSDGALTTLDSDCAHMCDCKGHIPVYDDDGVECVCMTPVHRSRWQCAAGFSIASLCAATVLVSCAAFISPTPRNTSMNSRAVSALLLSLSLSVAVSAEDGSGAGTSATNAEKEKLHSHVEHKTGVPAAAAELEPSIGANKLHSHPEHKSTVPAATGAAASSDGSTAPHVHARDAK